MRGEIFRNPEIVRRPNRWVEKAKKDARSRLPENADSQAHEKVANALEKRFKPYVEEGDLISNQITSPEYKQFRDTIGDFLQTRPGGVQCSDGRILNIAIFDPRVSMLHKRPQGMYETRKSTYNDTYVLEDQTIAASINTTIKRRKREDKSPDIVEFLGPHIDSVHPDHGCGAAKAKIEATGREGGMRFGGIDLYFEELGEGFKAFDTDIKRVGGNGTTFDMTHDAHSQGLIFGLRDAYLNGLLDSDKSLRQNLEELHEDGKILMTELMDETVKEDIAIATRRVGRKYGIDSDTKLDIRNPKHFARNVMAIGEIAKEITQHYEEREGGFSWIPEQVIASVNNDKEKSPKAKQNAIRTLAYHAVRNSVYRQLSGIEPGNHDLLEHPEQIVRVGPIGPAFNVETIAFAQVTQDGEMTKEDIEGADKLYGLAKKYMPQLKDDLKADFEKEARVIVVTGEFTEKKYVDEDAKEEAFEKVASNVRTNAAKFREKYAEEIKTGDTVVVSAIYKPGSRKLTHILSSNTENDNYKTDL